MTLGRPDPSPLALPLEADLRFRLGRAHRAVRGAWQARIADLGLTSPQAGALRAITEQPGTGLRELARRLGTDPMNAKRLADGLEREGLVVSRAHPADARMRVISPTDRGLALGREVERRAGEWQRAIEELLGADDAARLRLILERLEDESAALVVSVPVAASGDKARRG
jgi:DNA-binding MarR family transcriptional regulator